MPTKDRPLAPWLTPVPAKLLREAQTYDLSAGATLFRQNDRPRQIYCVLKGELRLLRTEENGMEVILQRSRGGFIAEASLQAVRYHCDAVASVPSRVLGFPITGFREALDQEGAFRAAWMALLANEVRKLRAQCERFCLKSAEARIFHYIESEGAAGVLTLDQTRKAWAAELGLTHEALYRTLNRLRRAGALVIEGRQISRRTIPAKLPAKCHPHA